MASFNKKFPPIDYSYNPDVDLQEVDQFGFVNAREAFASGVLSGDIEASEERFNGVANPEVLLSRAKDMFEASRISDYVRGSLDSLSKSERNAVENAVENANAAAGL